VIPLAVLGVIVPRHLVEWIFGSAYAPASAVLPLLMLSVVCMWFSHATAIATVAARLQAHFVWIQAVCVGVFFALNALLIPVWGMTGAAVARLAAAAIAPALTYALLRHRVGVTLSMRLLRRSAVAASVMAAGVAAMSSHPPLVIGVVGITLYAGVLWMTGSNPFASLVHEEIPT
jgi:O-antigen/teichoic acid export membrane protein